MIEDCPGCAGRGWIHGARECEICDGGAERLPRAA